MKKIKVMQMKVTLRKFLEITSKDIIHPYICNVYVDEYDKRFNQYFPELVKFPNGNTTSMNEHLCDINNLEPYMDYEIYGFDQEYFYGELDAQCIRLREIKEDG